MKKGGEKNKKEKEQKKEKDQKKMGRGGGAEERRLFELVLREPVTALQDLNKLLLSLIHI